MYFRFGRPYCYFRLSVVVTIILRHFLWRRCCGRVRLCRLNYNNTYFGSVLSYYHKISSVSKKFTRVWCHANNFQCTNWRPDCCILYPLHIQKKSQKGSAQRWTKFFIDQKLSWGLFFTPNAIRGYGCKTFTFIMNQISLQPIFIPLIVKWRRQWWSKMINVYSNFWRWIVASHLQMLFYFPVSTVNII